MLIFACGVEAKLRPGTCSWWSSSQVWERLPARTGGRTLRRQYLGCSYWVTGLWYFTIISCGLQISAIFEPRYMIGMRGGHEDLLTTAGMARAVLLVLRLL